MIATKLFDCEGNRIFLGDIVDPKTGRSGSMEAIEVGDLQRLVFLKDRHADFNHQDHDGWTALFYAVACHHIEIVKFLVQTGVNLDLQANDWWTALMVAIDHRQKEIVEVLCDAGAKIGNWTTEGYCELVIAMQDPEILEILLRNGADPELRHPRVPLITPLMIAVQRRATDPRSVKMLVRYGASVNSVNDAGQTALMLSVANADVLRSLLECGADIDKKDCDGESVYDYVKKKGADPRAAFVLNAWVNN